MEDEREAPYRLIRDLPPTDRPRERLRDVGAEKLSSAELLAILLRVGSAKENAITQAMRILSDMGGLAGLRRASFAELCNQKGVGEAKAAQIFAALELGIRVGQFTIDRNPILRTPDDIATLVVSEMSLFPEEHVRVMLLDTRNRLTKTVEVYVGSINTAVIRAADLLSDAVKARAAAIALVHNHPSGDPTPSEADVIITRNLREAAALMDIELVDHVIIAGGRWISMNRVELGFPAKTRPARAGG